MDFLQNKIFKLTFCAIVAAEILSFFSYTSPLVSGGFFLAVLAIALVLSLKKIEYGLCLLLAELFIGSQGYLFSLSFSGVKISIRIGLFLVILGVGLYKIIRDRKSMQLTGGVAKYYWLLLIFVLIGLLIGLKNNELSNVFFDVNAWLFFILFVVFINFFKDKDSTEKVLSVFIAATLWLSLKTIITLLLFSYGLTELHGYFYNWIRQSGVGEITYISGSIFRVFSQSQIFVLVGFLLVLSKTVFDYAKKNRRKFYFNFLYLYLTSLAILISQSRSFWVGLAAGGAFLVLFLIAKANWKIKKTAVLILIIIAAVLSEIIFVQLITLNFSSGFISNRFKNMANEPAGSSRINELEPLTENIVQKLFFGHGFGKILTYQSNDPRILLTQPDGKYTTYAFEWGYLDIWLKIGLLGLLAYTLLIYQIGKQTLKKIDSNPSIYLGLFLGLIALLITNIFSPYLNHPLGIGYLLMIETLSHEIS